MQSSTTARLLYDVRNNLFHPMSIWLLWIWISVLMPHELQAQQLHTYLDRDSVEVGEPFHLILVLQRQDGDQVVSWPNPESLESEDLHLVSREHFRPVETRDSLRFRFQYFGLQDTTLSPMFVDLITASEDTIRLASPELPLLFRAITTEEDEFRPMKPLYEFARSIWPWALLTILIALILYWLYRHRSAKKESPTVSTAPPPPFLDPIHELEQAVQRATIAAPSELIHDPTPSTIQLGDAIRAYLERVHDLPALEMTSREILDEWRRQAGNQEIYHALIDLFRLADRIKFARYSPTLEDILKLRQAALRFLQVVREEDQRRVQSLRELHEARNNSTESPSRKPVEPRQEDAE